MFREAEPRDFDAILQLYQQLHESEPLPQDGSARAVFDRILRTEGLHLFVLETGGEIVATTYLNVIPNITHGASPYAIIENVVVNAPLRGQGIGKEIIARTLQSAWAAGCYKAELSTGSRRASTHAFYRACGFSADDKTAYIARPPRPWSSQAQSRDVNAHDPANELDGSLSTDRPPTSH